MTIFFRLLDADDKGTALQEALPPYRRIQRQKRLR